MEPTKIYYKKQSEQIHQIQNQCKINIIFILWQQIAKLKCTKIWNA